MGFMDEIKALLKQIPADRQTLLFSATCDDNLFALCKVLLRDPALVEVAPRNTTAAEVEQRVSSRWMGERKGGAGRAHADREGLGTGAHLQPHPPGADKLAQQQLRQGASMRSPSTGSVTERAGKRCCWRFAPALCRPWWPPTWRLAASISAISTM